MSLADALEDMRPKKKHTVNSALESLSTEDREAWLNALDSGGWDLTDLRRILADFSGVDISYDQVRRYARKGWSA